MLYTRSIDGLEFTECTVLILQDVLDTERITRIRLLVGMRCSNKRTMSVHV